MILRQNWIDASRIRSGNGVQYVIDLVSFYNSYLHDIEEVHLWSYSELLDQVPDKTETHKHSHKFLELGILFKLYWQLFLLKKAADKPKLSVIFFADSATVSSFNPQLL